MTTNRSGTPMHVRILTTPTEVSDHVAAISEASDDNREALGFLPASVFADYAAAGRLWVAVREEDGAYAGHLLFGGRYPYLKITQLFVPPRLQRQGIGSRLINRLVTFGEENDYLTITARVAADLPANAFWGSIGFEHVHTVEGGRTTGRRINIRTRPLDVPTLFDLHHPPDHHVLRPSLEYEQLPVLETPAFALDLNVILDIVRDRVRRQAAGSLVRASFNHFVRLLITHEAHEELLRSAPKSGKSDPLLELIKELPVLPPVSDEVLDPIVERLRPLVFPDLARSTKRAVQDSSDLRHLAMCAHQGLTGFVTGERALLRAAGRIWKAFKVEIVSPGDFLEDEAPFAKLPPISAALEEGNLRIQPFQDPEQGKISRFLEGLRVGAEDAKEVWKPGATGRERTRLTARVGGRLIGVAAWDCPSPYSSERTCWLYVTEEVTGAIRFVDHVLESALSSQPSTEPNRVYLRHARSQTITRRTALQRGFRAAIQLARAETTLVKVAQSGVVFPGQWASFRDAFLRLTDLALPRRMPHFDAVRKNGLSLTRRGSGEQVPIGYFEFDTVISPGSVLYPGRPGAVIPIRKPYADDLLRGIRGQLSLLPSKEALLRIERAYFRSSRGAGSLSKGSMAVFYVSAPGGGEKAAVASARITSTSVLPVGEAKRSYSRQGVLSDRELERIGRSTGLVHAITFDNLTAFPQSLPFRRMKDLGCISGANLVTVEHLGYEHLCRILREGLGGRGGRRSND